MKIDFLKVKIPSDCIHSFDNNHDAVDTTNSKKRGLHYMIDTNPEFGINKTFVNDVSVTVNVSAKVLLDNYLDSISIDNIGQVFETFNKVSPLKFNVNDAIENAVVLNVDNTSNIKPTTDLQTVRDAMLLSKTNPKFITNQFNGRSLGIEINGSIKSEKRRLIGYSKPLDLQKKRGNK